MMMLKTGICLQVQRLLGLLLPDLQMHLSQVELEDLVENIGAKLVRQAAAKTNDLAGDGTTTSVVLAQGLIAKGVKVVAAVANPVQITRGIEKTVKALVAELNLMLKEVTFLLGLQFCS
ncbi:ruBisCO large subunit-binding protein subunit beta, chloroplastic [Iris pallida]|uniref:RuBisCO large subunit-binding protein subunit beta, chloroplastic n=1 Tax=Iris pallida TaxID=29817 RepID=A0AAX6G514_IRIPA|nr:ruBisCO large subunit-binding protein subunit beta, chloroplastic [Iris pallida]KAJ6823447.1 ruBisCO large subunit-binding protein subunit beta, chloroplastic [Iris pallida]